MKSSYAKKFVFIFVIVLCVALWQATCIAGDVADDTVTAAEVGRAVKNIGAAGATAAAVQGASGAAIMTKLATTGAAVGGAQVWWLRRLLKKECLM